MTVNELATCVKSELRVLSAYTGKVLCYNFNPEKHAEIGKREVRSLWAELKVTDSSFGNYAQPYLCVYADGTNEFRKENPEWRKYE